MHMSALQTHHPAGRNGGRGQKQVKVGPLMCMAQGRAPLDPGPDLCLLSFACLGPNRNILRPGLRPPRSCHAPYDRKGSPHSPFSGLHLSHLEVRNL